MGAKETAEAGARSLDLDSQSNEMLKLRRKDQSMTHRCDSKLVWNSLKVKGIFGHHATRVKGIE